MRALCMPHACSRAGVLLLCSHAYAMAGAQADEYEAAADNQDEMANEVGASCTPYAWLMRGLCVAYAWLVHGLCVPYACLMRGLCMAYA